MTNEVNNMNDFQIENRSFYKDESEDKYYLLELTPHFPSIDNTDITFSCTKYESDDIDRLVERLINELERKN